MRFEPLYVVGIVAKRNRTQGRERVGVETADRPVARRPNHELVAVGQIGKPLRLLQSPNPARLAGGEIDGVDRSVSELRHKRR